MKGELNMKFRCNTIRYNDGVFFLGISMGVDTRKFDRHLRLQLDLFKWAVVFMIRLKNKESK